MENLKLLDLKERQDNTIKKQLPRLPHFIVIKKTGEKNIKIPCANEAIAKRLLASYTNNNSNSKISLM